MSILLRLSFLILISFNIVISLPEKNSAGLGSLIQQLSNDQRKELDSIKNDKTLTKAQFREKIDAFINTLPENIKVGEKIFILEIFLDRLYLYHISYVIKTSNGAVDMQQPQRLMDEVSNPIAVKKLLPFQFRSNSFFIVFYVF
jgi:hypothetical protein